MPNEPPAAADPPGKPIAGRTALIGLLFAVFVSLWGQYASAQTSYNYLTFPQMPLCLLLPFLLFVITPNLILRSRFPSAALNTSELIVIFCMGLIAAMVPDWGLVRYLISLIVAPDITRVLKTSGRRDSLNTCRAGSWCRTRNRR